MNQLKFSLLYPWRLLNKIVTLRKFISWVCFFWNGNRRYIDGNGNVLLIWARGSQLKKVIIDIHGNQNRIVIKDGAQIENTHIFMRGSHHTLEIGERCYITGDSLWFEDYGCHLTIGNDTSIQGAHIAVIEPGRRVEIGEDCLLSNDIDIRTGDSHSVIDLTTMDRTNYALDVKIGSHVWICTRVQILKGVNIGKQSIVGAGSIVTSDIPPNCLAVGVPARVIKPGVTWLRSRLQRTEMDAFGGLPTTASEWYDRAYAFGERKCYEEAISNYDKAISVDPSYYKAWYVRGRMLFNLKRFSEAVVSFDNAVSVKPDLSGAWFQRGKAFVELHRYDEAIRSYKQALLFEPDLPEVWLCLGLALTVHYKYRDALKSYDQALTIRPDYGEAWYSKACCHALEGNNVLAIDSLRRASTQGHNAFFLKAQSESAFKLLRATNIFQELIDIQDTLHH